MDKLLDRDDTTVTSNPEATTGTPGEGQFVLTPTEDTPNPVVTIEPADPATVMDIVIDAPTNVKNVTIVFKNPAGEVIKVIVVPRNPQVCSNCFYNFTQSFAVDTQIIMPFEKIIQQGKFVVDEDVDNVKIIEITFTPEDPDSPIAVDELSVHACGEPTTTGATGASE